MIAAVVNYTLALKETILDGLIKRSFANFSLTHA